ncbi:hypothetical protein Dimus_012063 [Dionaea muscipula]
MISSPSSRRSLKSAAPSEPPNLHCARVTRGEQEARGAVANDNARERLNRPCYLMAIIDQISLKLDLIGLRSPVSPFKLLLSCEYHRFIVSNIGFHTGPPEGCKAIRTEKIILTIICLSSLLRSARQMLVHGHFNIFALRLVVHIKMLSTKRGGLAYLHSTKTIHRDIKGANLPVDLLGIVKLADFGMAKHLSGQAADLSLKGSPYWMAPELMVAVMRKDNSSDLAFAVDIWSLGCTVVEMFTGKPPWSECEGPAAMFKAIKESPPITEMLLSEGKDFLRLCFQRNPADRPSVSTLLEHHFVRNSQQLDVPLHLAFNGMTLIDRAPSPRELPSFKLDQMPMSPTRHAAANLETVDSGDAAHKGKQSSCLPSCDQLRERTEKEQDLPTIGSLDGVDGRRRLGESLRGKTAHNQDRHKFMRTSLIFGDVEIPRLGCQAPLWINILGIDGHNI